MSLEISQLSVGYGDRSVLTDITMSLAEGQILALLGPSGSGKSTLLRAIAGLIPIRSGRIVSAGRSLGELPTHLRRVGMVFQDDQLFPHLDVAANIEFGLKMSKVPVAERRRRRSELLRLVGLEQMAHRLVDELSGGEAKRVALARALAPAPEVLLLDEPLTGLDADLHRRLAHDIPAILRNLGTTAIWVTHDRAEAEAVADEIRELTPDGRLADSGPEVVELTAAETHPLRAAVLRVGTPTTDVNFAEDALASTSHLGLRDRSTGELLATSTWVWASHPGSSRLPQMQLRGMAVRSDLQGTGLGTLLLRAGTARARSLGAALLWARARDSALGFYGRAGWQVTGEGYVDPTTQLPHHDVVLELCDAEERPADPRPGAADGA